MPDMIFEKAIDRSKLVRKPVTVTVGGKTYQSYRWVRPTEAAPSVSEPKREPPKEPRDTQGRLLAQNGKPSNLNERQWHQVRTPEFKAWFGDWENDPESASKVVDENGEPMVVYHGTINGFTSFDRNAPRRTKGGRGGAFYFTRDPKHASVYAGTIEGMQWDDTEKKYLSAPYGTIDGGNVIPVFLNVRRPWRVNAGGKSYSLVEDDAFAEAVKTKSDGIEFKDMADSPGVHDSWRAYDADIWVVGNPKKIKSATGNSGAFDPADPDVRKSLTWSGWPLQGRKKIHGMAISIENRKGSVRRGVDADGHEWETKMHADYGYVRGSVGVDKDHVDCYVGPNPESTRVFIINQNDPTTGDFDEQKVMLGFNTPEEAKALYMKQYDRPGFFGSMEETDIETFKAKALDKKNHGKKLVIRKSRMGDRLIRLIERRNSEEIAAGILVEMEHTDDIEEAKRIALDHIKENPRYYHKLSDAGLIDEPLAKMVIEHSGEKKPEKTVAVDFDGVINSYKSGWLGEEKTDDPVPGAGEALVSMLNDGYKVIIYSTRADTEKGAKTIRTYLMQKLGLDNQYLPMLEAIEISSKKPIADVYIDDRALTFDGDWTETLRRVDGFKPWIGKSKRLVVPVIRKA